jgi:hypothetical protein
MARFNRAFAQQHLIAVDGQYAGNNLGILIMDNLTGHTDMTFPIVTLRYLFYNGIAASGTKIHEKLRKYSQPSIMHKCLKRSKIN